MNVALETRSAASSIGARRKLNAYISLTKPRVVELLLVVTAPTMILAQGGIPSLWLVLATLIGGAMSAGSAGAFNCYIDRDIDRLMKRTKNRPLVTGDLSDREALVFAWALGLASIVWLWVFTNWLAALLSLARHPALRRVLQPDPEAPHLAEHRLGRRCRAACPSSSAGRPSPAA